MVRGFYQLGSGMLTQNKVLSTISNNIANSQTTGYKRQEIVPSTFGQLLLSRVDSRYTEVGPTYLATVVDEHATIHTQGAFKPTGRSLDYAISGEGFFAANANGQTLYTRNGNFNIDGDGYLITQDNYRVLGQNGAPIYIGTSEFTSDDHGNIFVGGATVGKIGVYNFADYNTLVEARDGYYTAGGAANQVDNAVVKWQTLEASNVDMAEEMTDAIAAQRNFQYVSQALRTYDDVLATASTEIAKI